MAAKDSFTFTKEVIKKYKEKEAKETPEQKRAISEALVKANTEANNIPKGNKE